MAKLMSSEPEVTRRRFRSKKLLASFLVAVLVVLNTLTPASRPAFAQYTTRIPAAVDPGTPSFSGQANPVPAEPVAFNPGTSMLQAMFNADVAAGGTSYWFDRVLARPFVNGDSNSSLFSRGRALYMYTHTPGTLGFAGGYAYRERPTGSNQNLYTISLSGVNLSETNSQRMEFPSHWRSQHTGGSWTFLQRKFITENNVAVTVLTL